jgi:hypothetical protein
MIMYCHIDGNLLDLGWKQRERTRVLFKFHTPKIQNSDLVALHDAVYLEYIASQRLKCLIFALPSCM